MNCVAADLDLAVNTQMYRLTTGKREAKMKQKHYWNTGEKGSFREIMKNN